MDLGDREPFNGGTQAYSGARFERAVGPGGQPVVLKHLPAAGDWLTRATDGLGRARWLWESGTLDRVSAKVDHAVLDVLREDDHDLVVMADVSDVLLPPDVRITESDVARLLAGMSRLHAAFEGDVPDGLCTPARRNSLFAPSFHLADEGEPNPLVVRPHVIAGWERFAERWPDDVVRAISKLHADPELLEHELLMAAPPTLLHGDAKLENLGLRSDDLVAVDWGELTGIGPAEMDVVWFATTGTTVAPGAPTWRIDAMPDDVFAVYNAHAVRPLDPRALDLACLGMAAQLGWYDDVPLGDDAAQARAAHLDRWWQARAQAALETWSPV